MKITDIISEREELSGLIENLDYVINKPMLQKFSKGTQLPKITLQQLWTDSVILAKIKYFMRAAKECIVSDNPLSLALNVRAIIEHSAIFEYLIQISDEKIRNIVDKSDFNSMRHGIAELLQIHKRIFFGSSEFFDYTKIKKLKAGEKIKENLEIAYPRALKMYDFLCEFVHPNFGGNKFISFSKFKNKVIVEGFIDPPFKSEYVIAAITEILKYLYKFIHIFEHQTWRSSMLGDGLYNFLSEEVPKCGDVKDSTVGNLKPRSINPKIFQPKNISEKIRCESYVDGWTSDDGDYESDCFGNGFTKETAIYFPAAKTISEFDKFICYYIDAVYGINYKTMPAGASDGFIFKTVCVLYDEKLWFKFPEKLAKSH